MYEIFEILCERHGITPYKFCKDTGIRTSTISSWKKKNSLAGSKLSTAICKYFGISMDYLMTGSNDIATPSKELTVKDEREIGRDLDRIMDEIENDEDGPLYYNGEPIDEESLKLLRNALELGLRELKRENKVKYGRKKKKD